MADISNLVGFIFFLPIWLYCAWLILDYWFGVFQTIPHILPGRKFAYFFHLSLLNFTEAENCLSLEGIGYHQRVKSRIRRAALIIISIVIGIFMLVGFLSLGNYMELWTL